MVLSSATAMLQDILEQQHDLLHHSLTMRGADEVPVATLIVTVQALNALKSILA